MSSESSDQLEKDPRSPTGRLTRTDIVVIEDNEQDRAAIRAAIEQCGYHSFEIHDARRVRRILANQKLTWMPKAIIVDLVLEGSSGYEVLRTIAPKYHNKRVPFIVVSSMCSDEDIYEAQTAGAHAFVAKPYTAEDLIDAVEFSLDNLRKSQLDRKIGIYIKRAEITSSS